MKLLLQLTENKTALLTHEVDPDDVTSVLPEFDALQATHKQALLTATLTTVVEATPADRVLAQLLQRPWGSSLQFQGTLNLWSVFFTLPGGGSLQVSTVKDDPSRLTVQGGLCGLGVPSYLWMERGRAVQVAHADVRRCIRAAGKP